MKTLKNQTYKNQKFRQLVAAILLLSSTLGIISPVLAQVAAGSDIKNTATAKFKDDAGTVYNSSSNEIIIKVAEVAGINITAQPPSVTNPNAGDTLFVDYIISNTGNDPTQFFIPGTATLSDNTNFSQDGKIQIIAVNGTNLGAAVEVPNTGDTTGKLLTANGSIPANFGSATNGTIKVRVPIKVAVGTASGTNLTVTLGNTNKPAPDNQNQDRSTDIDADDFYTVDNADGTTSETNGTPGNGVREAMATSATITVNARQQAFSTVLKAVSSYSSGANANDISDDVLTYALALKVENPASPPSGLVVSDLYGTGIKVEGLTTTPYVLVSDAIPTGMKLGNANPVAPSGWQVVYTTDDLAVNALNASWLTTRPSGTITRIGYVYDTTTTPLAKGSTTTGFSFTVTPDAGFTGEQIANIAQTFGQSKPGAVVPGTATQIVYDESGDQTSNNGLDGTNPDSTTAGGVTPTNGGITDGKADIIADGVDPGTGNDPTANNTNQGNNTGAGAGTKPVGGEVNIYVIAATPLNGPKDQPGATGPTGTNDDFTNKSIVVPADKNPTDTLTDTETTPITFDNTVKNTSGGSQIISLLPTPPTVTGDLLDGTKVTIKDANGNTAIYTYTAANGFTFDSGTGTTAGNPISATNPIKVTVAAGDVASYQVIVDLPAAPQLKGFPVPITAFVDVNGDGKPAGEPSNITIDRVYTNYLELKKEARILEANGTPVSGAAGTFTINQADLAVAATPGRIIEYRITYTNISTTGGANSVILPVKDLVITENGSTGGNTWFSTTVDPKYSATVTQGSAVGTSVTVTTAANASVTDIQQYEDAIANVNPAGTGTFIFQRKIK
ncbi:beta strand repeat-containing protein [Calothrix sp. PCC 6303]|uniref:beta strand repeat-containing protein n=1 Tax=Calothrix sp. PCC 6303 TaxID=1170562 RepID=UPI0002A009A8|nr:hypothetical protein [Calothrix sp. PCC 6303]AFZ01193.1 hypothetical protein Cal6303_2172 [Calothrix sp. PCC 6303]